MAYATLDEVKARAGRLAPAWGATTDPSDTDIGGFLDAEAALLDAALEARGATVPATGTVAAALEGVNADGALVLAIEGTWPGGKGNEETRAILEAAQRRYRDAWAAIRDGKHAAVQLAVESLSGKKGSEADNFWTAEPDYPTLTELLETNAYTAPGFARGQRF
jgi:hypothetical protein